MDRRRSLAALTGQTGGEPGTPEAMVGQGSSRMYNARNRGPGGRLLGPGGEGHSHVLRASSGIGV